MSLPRRVAVDAWPGAAAQGGLVPGAAGWGAKRGLTRSQQVLPFTAPVDQKRWENSDVGYGVLVLDDPATGWTADKAAGVDPLVPAAVQRLIEARPGTVLLRWSSGLADRKVVRYFPDKAQTLEIGLTTFGVGKNRLPRYVLIAGGPAVIPWSVQYAFAVRHAVGRLPFTGADLDPYIDALIGDWPGSSVDVTAPVIWSVDHGPSDITRLMRATITTPLEKAFAGTLDGMVHLAGADAGADALLDAIAPSGRRAPALVVTSSHGATPLDPTLSAVLGLPVDADHQTVNLDDLDAAMPAGSIWFAQACCSAGGAGESNYTGLIQPGTIVDSALSAVAALGPVVSPAALRLLGRESPVRAILGHVEPTFDWTLRDPSSGQTFTADLVKALSSNLHFGAPAGYAFEDYRLGVGSINSKWAKARQAFTASNTELLDEMARLRLTAIDRQSLVLLGDPTVTLPPLP